MSFILLFIFYFSSSGNQGQLRSTNISYLLLLVLLLRVFMGFIVHVNFICIGYSARNSISYQKSFSNVGFVFFYFNLI